VLFSNRTAPSSATVCTEIMWRDAETGLLPFPQVYNARKRMLGAEDPNTLGSMNNLAVALGDLGRHADAEALHREAFDTRRRVLGAEHPDTLTSMNHLAGLLQDLGRHADAETLHRKALDTRRRVLGVEHPDTLRSMNNLALALWNLGRHADAEALHREALDSRRRVLGAEHPDTLQSMASLAGVLCMAGAAAEAQALYGASSRKSCFGMHWWAYVQGQPDFGELPCTLRFLCPYQKHDCGCNKCAPLQQAVAAAPQPTTACVATSAPYASLSACATSAPPGPATTSAPPAAHAPGPRRPRRLWPWAAARHEATAPLQGLLPAPSRAGPGLSDFCSVARREGIVSHPWGSPGWPMLAVPPWIPPGACTPTRGVVMTIAKQLSCRCAQPFWVL
jgi:hypothetical protein